MRYLVLVLLLLLSPVWAEELTVEDFAMLVKHLPTALSGSPDYKFNPSLADLATRLADVTRVKAGDRLFVVDMKWVADVGEAMAGEQAEARRKLLFVNMVDTLNGMLVEFSSGYAVDAVSRQEMNDALERALGKTSEIRISAGVSLDGSAAWCGAPGLVINQPGEAISLTGIQSSENETTSQAQMHGFSGTGESGQSAGGLAGGSSGGSVGSGFSAAGSAVGGVSVSGASGGMVHSGSSVSAGQSPVPVNTSAQPQQVSAPPQSAGSSVVSRPAEPPRARPVPPPPPPKAPAPFRPPPKPKVPVGANMFFWVLMGAGIIGFIVVVFLIIKNLRTKVAHEQARIALVEKDLPVERMRSETIYDKALREAEKGNYAEAIRLLTIGSLLLLEARRVINYQDSLTNGEYLRELLVEQHLHSMFATPLALFDRLIYGFQSPDKKDFEIFRVFYLDLERLKK